MVNCEYTLIPDTPSSKARTLVLVTPQIKFTTVEIDILRYASKLSLMSDPSVIFPALENDLQNSRIELKQQSYQMVFEA